MSVAAFLDPKTLSVWVSPVAAILTASGTAFVAYRVALFQRGNYFKQIHTIELATKRNEYWMSYLKTSKLANGPDSVSYLQTKNEVSAALIRIKNEADEEMSRLSWENQITRSLRKQQHTLKAVTRSWMWWSFMMLRWFFVIDMVLFFGLLVNFTYRGGIDSARLFLLGASGIGCSFMSAWFYRQAQKERYPEPPAPLLDRM